MSGQNDELDTDQDFSLENQPLLVSGYLFSDRS